MNNKYSYNRVLIPFLAMVALFGVIMKGGHWYHQWITAVRLDTVKPQYYHYEFVDIRLRSHDPEVINGLNIVPLRVEVLWQGVPVKTIGGLTQVDLHWNDDQGALIGRWPCPWNAPEGEYQVSLIGPANIQKRLQVRPFRIVRRKPLPLPHRFVVMTMESMQPLATMRVKTPDGTIGGWKGLLDWVQFVGADALWILAGQTRVDKPNEVWVSYNFPMIPLVAEECKRRGIKFGVYAMCYLTMSKERLSRYQYAEEIEDGKPVFTRAISIRDPQRPKDIAELLKHFKAIPGVDYVGLDYIRNALGGYELIDDFFQEMTWIPRPENWNMLSRDERILWFARKKIARTDRNFIDAWQWWRAHHVALIVRQIRREIGYDIPLWAFTLTWEKGWQHGQDPVMMNDAGIDADSLMLYEANAPQFEDMIKTWHAYVRHGDVQLVVGDVVDWALHQRSPRGPGELVYRLEKAMRNIYQDGNADGIFIHDLARALWGRLGPNSTMDWMLAIKSTARHFRALPDHYDPPPALRSKTLLQAPAPAVTAH